MIEPQAQKGLPPWTEDAWDRWFYSFMKEITPSNGEGRVESVAETGLETGNLGNPE